MVQEVLNMLDEKQVKAMAIKLALIGSNSELLKEISSNLKARMNSEDYFNFTVGL